MANEKNNFEIMCSFIEQVTAIESIKKTTPELSRALNQLKDNLKC